jgi:hypothetical protein
MPALFSHGAPTAWMVALVAAVCPAPALAAPVADPVPPPDNGTQQQQQQPPAADPPAPCDPSASTCPASDPPVVKPDPPVGPSGPVADLPAKPDVPAAPALVDPKPAAPDPKPATVVAAPLHAAAPAAAVQEQQPAHVQQPVRREDPQPDKPKPSYDKPKQDKPKQDKPGYDKPKPNDDKPGYGDDHRDHGDDDHEHDHVVFDRETIRLGGCDTFSAATAKATFERIRYEKDRFKVSVKDLAVPEGTVLTVRIDGRVAGTLTIDDEGAGKLTRRGDHLPKFLRLDGDERVTISNADGDVLLSRACRRQNRDDNDDD